MICQLCEEYFDGRRHNFRVMRIDGKDLKICMLCANKID
jgi:hypothetical protein